MNEVAILVLLGVPYTGLLLFLIRLPDSAALRDHQARAESFLHGVRVGRQA